MGFFQDSVSKFKKELVMVEKGYAVTGIEVKLRVVTQCIN